MGWRMTMGCLENGGEKMQVVKECIANEITGNVNGIGKEQHRVIPAKLRLFGEQLCVLYLYFNLYAVKYIPVTKLKFKI